VILRFFTLIFTLSSFAQDAKTSPPCAPQTAPQPLPASASTLLEQTQKIAQSSVTCHAVDIEAQKPVEDAKYLETGVGSVFTSKSEPGKLFILTAAHVVSNSDRIQIRCKKDTLDAKLRGISQTQDLAVLEISNPSKELKPAFNWDGISLPIPEVMAMLPQEFNSDEKLLPGGYWLASSARFGSPVRVEAKFTTHPSEHPLLGSRSALLLEDHGVRPGMSGSPILYRASPAGKHDRTVDLFDGLVTKTYVNHHESVAIPVDAVSKALPDLMQGKDPARSQSSPFRYKKKLILKNGRVYEMPELVFNTSPKETHVRALCQGPFSNTSQGNQQSLDSGGYGGAGDGSGPD
jgi:hypothetical protein